MTPTKGKLYVEKMMINSLLKDTSLHLTKKTSSNVRIITFQLNEDLNSNPSFKTITASIGYKWRI